MKNMYLAAAMVVSLAFSACSDEESGKADRAYKPIEIYGNINEVVNNVQETHLLLSNGYYCLLSLRSQHGTNLRFHCDIGY